MKLTLQQPHGLGGHPNRKESDLGKLLTDYVSEKLEEGNFKGAVRLASSDDTLAPMSEATFQALLERHPSPHPDSEISPIDEEVSTIVTVSEEEVSRGISSFRKGSAGGPDGLRPQHLKDMVSVASSSQVFLPALTAFVQLMLEGRTPTFIRTYFFGANLTAIRKSDGGVRPIAVGCTLRRLVASFWPPGSWVMVWEEDRKLLSTPRGSTYAILAPARQY